VSVADLTAPAESLLRLAKEAQRKADIASATELYTELLTYDPEQPDALHFLGVIDYQQGRLEQGCVRIEAAVRQRPEAADFLNNLGTVYLGLKRVADALRVYTRSVELAPKNASFASNLATALAQAAQPQAAISVARKILADHPGYPAALNVMGNSARQLGDYQLAKQSFAELVRVAPQDPESHYNLGVALQDLWDMAGARAAYEIAIGMKPNVARYYVNHGAALMKLHEIALAGQSYLKALELEPSLAEAHYNYAICCYLLGDLRTGSTHYEWRLKIDETSLSRPRDMSVPQWDGSVQPNKTILLHSEQGLGDMLQFIRFAPAVAAMVGKVVVEVQKPIRQLLQDAYPELTFIAKGDTPPPFDLHCPLMSLLHKLQVQLSDLPACAVPYFKVRTELNDKWRERLSGKSGRKVAIVWQGNPKAKVDRGRSMPLATLLPLLQIPGLRFISLQKNEGAEQIAALPPDVRDRIETLGDDFDSGPDAFLDTVAVMANCDLVLTTDTAIAHVAGAMGRPTYLMLKKTPDWRWLLERTDSPWYPSMRLFRQRDDGNWGEVIAAIARDLQPLNNALVQALALHRAGQLQAAEQAYKTVLIEQPEEPVARHHLGVIALQRGQADVAETQIRAAIAVRPDDADALANLALALKAQGRLDEAIAMAQQVLQISPQHAATHNNLGNMLKEQGKFESAIAAYRQAIALAPGKDDFIHNLGLALLEAGQLSEAEAALKQALRQAPHNPDYHFDLARCLLMQGQWEGGWTEYEYRRQMNEFGKVSEPNGPRWQGEHNPQLVLLVHAEQGLGDTLQFVRFIAQARARVGKVMLVVPPQLKVLLRQVQGVDEIYGYGEAVPGCHVHVPLLSLPQVLGAVPEGGAAYLQPLPAELQRWREWRSAYKGKLIGLNWQGNPKARADAGRSLHLTQLAALADVPGITFVALQKGAALDQVSQLPPSFPLVVPPAPFDEGAHAFLDSAALLSVCDAVVTTDTAMAHLAGALGVPGFVLLKHCPDWRWQFSGSRSVWYDTLQLIRQPTPGAWPAVIEQLKNILSGVLPTHAAVPSLEQALAMHQAGQPAQARPLYQAILRADPANILALHFLGVAEYQGGDPVLAERHIRAALALKPDYAEAWGNLGLALKTQKRLGEAEAAFKQALQLGPQLADVCNNYGNLLAALKRYPEAMAHYERAIILQPNKADGYHNLGNALGDLERYDEAVEKFRRALALRPRYVSALNGLGKSLRMQEKTEAAIAVFKEAIEAEPNNADCWSNLGVCHRELAQYDEALKCYDEAIKLRPDHAECWSNRAIALHYTACFAEAEKAYVESLRLKPDRADAHFGLASILLTQGRWSEGWKEYEWRRFMRESGPVRTFPQPLWDGSAQPDKTLLLFVEQGLGDTLQSLRLLPLARAKFAKIILEVQPGLYRLVQAAVGDTVLVRQGDALPAFDTYAPLMSLPALLNLTVETLPAPPCYLHAEPEMVASWAARLPQGKLRVGLNWQGNPKASVDKGRSVPLRLLQPILETERVDFICLQKNAGLEQLDELSAELRARITTLGEGFDAGKDAFIDTAAVMANLDLVITSDTAMAHLAGALGVPCWTMLKFMPDWRWLFSRTDTPWYPSMQLFRQQREGDWPQVAQDIAKALHARVQNH
jgi:tetratricopeptide (TPR) repeat protein